MRTDRKRRVSTFLSTKLVNPPARFLAKRGLLPGTALLETRGRKSGEPRVTPVGDGLRDREFWIVAEHGYGANYVKNIQSDPRVRVKVGRRWHAGTAHLLPEDDPVARMRTLRRPLNDSMVRLMSSAPLSIRVDLDDA